MGTHWSPHSRIFKHGGGSLVWCVGGAASWKVAGVHLPLASLHQPMQYNLQSSLQPATWRSLLELNNQQLDKIMSRFQVVSRLRYIAYALLLPARVYLITVVMSIQSGGVDIDKQGDLRCRQLKMDHSVIIVDCLWGICGELVCSWADNVSLWTWYVQLSHSMVQW